MTQVLNMRMAIDLDVVALDVVAMAVYPIPTTAWTMILACGLVTALPLWCDDDLPSTIDDCWCFAPHCI